MWIKYQLKRNLSGAAVSGLIIGEFGIDSCEYRARSKYWLDFRQF